MLMHEFSTFLPLPRWSNQLSTRTQVCFFEILDTLHRFRHSVHLLCPAFSISLLFFFHSMTLTSSPKYSALHVNPKPSSRQPFFMSFIISLISHSTSLCPSLPSSSKDNFGVLMFAWFFNSSNTVVVSCFFCLFCLHVQLFCRPHIS